MWEKVDVSTRVRPVSLQDGFENMDFFGRSTTFAFEHQGSQWVPVGFSVGIKPHADRYICSMHVNRRMHGACSLPFPIDNRYLVTFFSMRWLYGLQNQVFGSSTYI